jgi:hypothetical protein
VLIYSNELPGIQYLTLSLPQDYYSVDINHPLRTTIANHGGLFLAFI